MCGESECLCMRAKIFRNDCRDVIYFKFTEAVVVFVDNDLETYSFRIARKQFFESFVPFVYLFGRLCTCLSDYFYSLHNQNELSNILTLLDSKTKELPGTVREQ